MCRLLLGSNAVLAVYLVVTLQALLIYLFVDLLQRCQAVQMENFKVNRVLLEVPRLLHHLCLCANHTEYLCPEVFMEILSLPQLFTLHKLKTNLSGNLSE